uniref:CSON008284 protein n=1 Tax=Culicoides sonorensis TaxID=179676 RepID=A0A336LEX2_CULSO
MKYDKISLKNKLSASARRTAAGMAMELFEQHQGTHILQSLDGFALAVGADGRFLYISETVSIYLGLSQVELTGSSIFDYVHHGDHAEIAEQLGLSLSSNSNTGMNSPHSIHSDDPGTSHGTHNPDAQMTISSNSAYKGYDRAFCIRMKSTLTKRGCHFKSSGYRVVLVLCRLRTQYNFTQSKKSQPQLMGIVGLAVALPPPSIHEIRLECDMFVTRINFDFTIAHCEPKVTELLDYTPDELVGRNIYSLCHVINKGQVLTHYYRVMNKNGGFTWIQTCATVVCNSKNAEEQNIICVNYVISRKENANLILDTCQMEPVKSEEIENPGLEHNKSDSPGSGPSNDGLGRHNRNPDLKGVTKTKSPERRNRKANNSEGNVNSTNLSSATSSVKSVEEVTTPVASTRGRKRKIKFVPTKEDVEGPNTKVANIEQNSDVVSSERNESSVKDLEHAMSKHLPATTDFSTDTLLKQQQQSDKTGNAIQWNGHNTSQFPQQSQGTMPATALLRQLYANRESVIRATSSRSGSGFYPDTIQSSALPTPPGSESSYDTQYTTLHHQVQKPGDAFTNLVSAYGSYSSAAAMEYQNAMTPPSSVSPRDTSSHHGKSHSSGNNSNIPSTSSGYDYISSVYAEQSESSLPPLPLKPQAYSAAAAAMHHSSIAEGYGAIDQSQYFPHPTGFHLYHKGQGWYSTPT